MRRAHFITLYPRCLSGAFKHYSTPRIELRFLGPHDGDHGKPSLTLEQATILRDELSWAIVNLPIQIAEQALGLPPMEGEEK